jgi:DNA invertase Pin-like site-specific DNA recombinase
MQIGYARVSTHEQSLDLQIDALKGAGCETIFEDHGVSGVADERPGLERALAALSPGDTLTVWRLDRLARSMLDLTDTVHWLQANEIGFHSICEYIDTSSAVGELILHVLSSIVQFERRLLIERTNAGIEAARQRGAQFGRPAAINGETLREALFLRSKGMTVPDIAQALCVGRSTLYRYLLECR